MSIDTATAAKVAKLARIKVEDNALPELAEEFNLILGFIGVKFILGLEIILQGMLF